MIFFVVYFIYLLFLLWFVWFQPDCEFSMLPEEFRACRLFNMKVFVSGMLGLGAVGLLWVLLREFFEQNGRRK